MREVTELKQPEVGVLYKYMKATERALDVITEGVIWYSKPDRFNDPFDCDIDIASNVTWNQYAGMIRWEGQQKGKSKDEIRRMIDLEANRLDLKVPSEYIQRVRSGVPEIKRRLRSEGILALSSIPDSIPMWSYYADSHSGVCIGLKREPGNALGSTAANPVQYTDDYPDISYYDLIENPGYLTKTLMRTKSRAWEHELEWRVIITNGDVLHELPGPIDCVIFGVRTADEFKKAVETTVKSVPEVKLFQARKAVGQFRLALTPYSSTEGAASDP